MAGLNQALPLTVAPASTPTAWTRLGFTGPRMVTRTELENARAWMLEEADEQERREIEESWRTLVQELEKAATKA